MANGWTNGTNDPGLLLLLIIILIISGKSSSQNTTLKLMRVRIGCDFLNSRSVPTSPKPPYPDSDLIRGWPTNASIFWPESQIFEPFRPIPTILGSVHGGRSALRFCRCYDFYCMCKQHGVFKSCSRIFLPYSVPLSRAKTLQQSRTRKKCPILERHTWVWLHHYRPLCAVSSIRIFSFAPHGMQHIRCRLLERTYLLCRLLV